MANDLKFIGIRYVDDQTQINFFGLPTFGKYIKLEFPGIEYDTFLHYEPSAGIMDYTFRGIPYKMTPEQQKAIDNYMVNFDVPKYTYDPAQANVYCGIRTSADAKEKKLKTTLVAITNEICKFNEVTQKWDDIHAIICNLGKAIFNLTNDYSYLDNDEVEHESSTGCTFNIQEAARVLTEKEWNSISISRTRETDTFNFVTNSWEDLRSLDEAQADALSKLNVERENMLAILNFNYYNDVNIFANIVNDDADIEDQQIVDMFETIYGTENAPSLLLEYKNFIIKLKDKINLYDYLKKEISLIQLATMFVIEQATAVDQIDNVCVIYTNRLTELKEQYLSEYIKAKE